MQQANAGFRGSISALRDQFRRIWCVLVCVYIPAGMVLLGLFSVWFFTDKPISLFTRDPLAIVEDALEEIRNHPEEGLHALGRLELPFYIGAVSGLGVLLWASGAAVAFFAVTQLKSRESAGARRFLWMGGVFSCLLLADDFFLLHERALPHYWSLGEHYVFAFYFGYTAFFLALNRKFILQSDYLLLILAFGAFAVSLGVDHAPFVIPQPYFFEDGGKFLGIAGWTGYLVHTSAEALRRQRTAGIDAVGQGPSHAKNSTSGSSF